MPPITVRNPDIQSRVVGSPWSSAIQVQQGHPISCFTKFGQMSAPGQHGSLRPRGWMTDARRVVAGQSAGDRNDSHVSRPSGPRIRLLSCKEIRYWAWHAREWQLYRVQSDRLAGRAEREPHFTRSIPASSSPGYGKSSSCQGTRQEMAETHTKRKGPLNQPFSLPGREKAHLLRLGIVGNANQ